MFLIIISLFIPPDEMLFGKKEINADALVSFAKFCKNLLPNRKFTFWDWFYGILILTRDHLRESWEQGFIAGFISRNHTEDRLLDCKPGTFLLRFSESILGKLIILSYNF